IALLLGKNIGLQSRLLIQESLNQITLGGMVRLVKFILIFTLIIEGIGAVILFIRWANEFGIMKSIYYGIFHSISAFNNAGFDLMGDFSSMTKYIGDYTIVLTLSSLFIIGGLGFTVILDILKKKPLKKLTLQTKIVLIMTLALNILGTLAIFILEYNNPHTLGALPIKDQLLGAYFHGVVPRTAGFNTLSMPDLTLSSQLVTMLLMFIGGASGGTAGGIKVTTFAVILLAIWSVIKKQNNVNIMGRQLSKEIIFKAFAIAVYSAGIICFIVFFLTITEDAPFNVLLFEVISAFGTVGVTLNLTPELTTAGKVLIAITMFIGRVGPLTIAFTLASGKKQQTIKYTEEKMMIG
ncbi:MAG: TrkH family potassium uptake protein, partial [Lysinibacillus sp.]